MSAATCRKPREGVETTRERLLLDFLAQVIRNVRVQRVDRELGIAPDLRQEAEPQDVFHVEVEPQLAGREREALAVDGSPGQQIHVQSLELARARSAQRKPVRSSAFGDEGVNLVQQRRQALDLVDDHPASARLGVDVLSESIGGKPAGGTTVCERRRRRISAAPVVVGKFRTGEAPGEPLDA